MNLANRKNFRTTISAIIAGVLTCACGEDAQPKEPNAGSGTEPLYLIQTAIYGPDDTLNYVLLSHELNLVIDQDRLDTAREFPGYTGVWALNGRILAADGAAPFVRRYEVNDDFVWSETGELNFGAYPMDEYNFMNFYFQSIKSDDTVYFFYGADKTGRVVWSPTEWTIESSHDDTNLPIPSGGWLLQNGGNRTGIHHYDGPVVQPFSEYSEEIASYSDASWLAVYDESSHEEIDVLEVACPGIQQATKDEQGNLYFSTTFNLPIAALYGAGPAPCVVRVNADGTLDETFAPNDLTEWTGGYYAVNFRYLSDGKAIANVLHDDRITGLDPSGEVDPAIATQIDEDPTLWELHVIDLDAGSSTIVAGFQPEHDLGYYTTFMDVDGRTFIIVQLDTETTKSAIYELDVDTATVSLMGEAEGDIWTVQRVR